MATERIRQTLERKANERAELDKASSAANEHDNFYVVIHPVRGREVVSRYEIPPRTCFLEYKGQLISRQQGHQLESEYTETDKLFYFQVGASEEWFCVNAQAESPHLGRLLSHSCRPGRNAQTHSMKVDGIPRLYFHSTKTIKPNQALFWNYNDNRASAIEDNAFLKESVPEEDQFYSPDKMAQVWDANLQRYVLYEHEQQEPTSSAGVSASSLGEKNKPGPTTTDTEPQQPAGGVAEALQREADPPASASHQDPTPADTGSSSVTGAESGGSQSGLLDLKIVCSEEDEKRAELSALLTGTHADMKQLEKHHCRQKPAQRPDITTVGVGTLLDVYDGEYRSVETGTCIETAVTDDGKRIYRFEFSGVPWDKWYPEEHLRVSQFNSAIEDSLDGLSRADRKNHDKIVSISHATAVKIGPVYWEVVLHDLATETLTVRPHIPAGDAWNPELHDIWTCGPDTYRVPYEAIEVDRDQPFFAPKRKNEPSRLPIYSTIHEFNATGKTKLEFITDRQSYKRPQWRPTGASSSAVQPKPRTGKKRGILTSDSDKEENENAVPRKTKVKAADQIRVAAETPEQVEEPVYGVVVSSQAELEALANKGKEEAKKAVRKTVAKPPAAPFRAALSGPAGVSAETSALPTEMAPPAPPPAVVTVGKGKNAIPAVTFPPESGSVQTFEQLMATMMTSAGTMVTHRTQHFDAQIRHAFQEHAADAGEKQADLVSKRVETIIEQKVEKRFDEIRRHIDSGFKQLSSALGADSAINKKVLVAGQLTGQGQANALEKPVLRSLENKPKVANGQNTATGPVPPTANVEPSAAAVQQPSTDGFLVPQPKPPGNSVTPAKPPENTTLAQQLSASPANSLAHPSPTFATPSHLTSEGSNPKTPASVGSVEKPQAMSLDATPQQRVQQSSATEPTLVHSASAQVLNEGEAHPQSIVAGSSGVLKQEEEEVPMDQSAPIVSSNLESLGQSQANQSDNVAASLDVPSRDATATSWHQANSTSESQSSVGSSDVSAPNSQELFRPASTVPGPQLVNGPIHVPALPPASSLMPGQFPQDQSNYPPMMGQLSQVSPSFYGTGPGFPFPNPTNVQQPNVWEQHQIQQWTQQMMQMQGQMPQMMPAQQPQMQMPSQPQMQMPGQPQMQMPGQPQMQMPGQQQPMQMPGQQQMMQGPMQQSQMPGQQQMVQGPMQMHGTQPVYQDLTNATIHLPPPLAADDDDDTVESDSYESDGEGDDDEEVVDAANDTENYPYDFVEVPCTAIFKPRVKIGFWKFEEDLAEMSRTPFDPAVIAKFHKGNVVRPGTDFSQLTAADILAWETSVLTQMRKFGVRLFEYAFLCKRGFKPSNRGGDRKTRAKLAMDVSSHAVKIQKLKLTKAVKPGDARTMHPHALLKLQHQLIRDLVHHVITLCLGDDKQHWNSKPLAVSPTINQMVKDFQQRIRNKVRHVLNSANVSPKEKELYLVQLKAFGQAIGQAQKSSDVFSYIQDFVPTAAIYPSGAAAAAKPDEA